MISRIRKHCTYTNVVLTLALVFMMTGGAYAAGKYVITSTKQISPKVLKSLKGANGKSGLNGANGANGAPGAIGPAGPAGSGTQGAEGPKGAEGKPGTNGESVTNTAILPGNVKCEKEGGAEFKVGTTGAATKACNGKTGFTETLPPGKTEEGEWSATPVETPGFGPGVRTGSTSISFVIPLQTVPTLVYDKEGKEAEHAVECPGTAEAPKAKEGFLCVYTQFEPETKFLEETSLVHAFGAHLNFEGKGGETAGIAAYGSWAVTG